MARLTASSMIDLVRDYCGGETTETLSAARILRFLNQAYFYYCGKHQFPELLTTTTITTSSGTNTYDLSVADVQEINYIVNTTSKLTLRRIDSKQYNEYTQGDTTGITGTPVYYAELGVGTDTTVKKLVLYPTPDGTYSLTMSYFKEPAALTTSPTDTKPIIPDVWDEVIIHRAASKGWMLLGDEKKAMLHASASQAAEQELVDRIWNRTTQPRRTQSRVGKALSGI